MASEFNALNAASKITGCVPIEHKPSCWGFVGKVPRELSYVMRDGSPISDEMAKNIASFGPGLFTKEIRTVSFATEAEALAAIADYELASVAKSTGLITERDGVHECTLCGATGAPFEAALAHLKASHPKAGDVARVLEFIGEGEAQFYGTGGNCTAIRIVTGSIETLITSIANECQAPESLDEMCNAIEYEDDEDGDNGRNQKHEERDSALGDILLEMYGPSEGEPLPLPLEALTKWRASRGETFAPGLVSIVASASLYTDEDKDTEDGAWNLSRDHLARPDLANPEYIALQFEDADPSLWRTHDGTIYLPIDPEHPSETITVPRR